MTDRPVYSVYGLKIRSDIALPLPMGRTAAGVDLELVYSGRSLSRRPAAERDRSELVFNERGWEFRYQRISGDWASFRYSRADRRLVIIGSEQWNDMIPFLLGVVCGALLRDRGTCVLHGSAVNYAGRGVALLGPSGAGKSTLAGALVTRGAQLVTDDIVVPERLDGGIAVHAGHRYFSLERVAAAILPVSEALSVMFPSYPDISKLWVDTDVLPGGFHAAAAQLSAIFILDPRGMAQAEPKVIPLPPRRATIALMRHIYGLNSFPPDGGLLHSCAEIARLVPVARLLRPDDLAALHGTAELVLAAGPVMPD